MGAQGDAPKPPVQSSVDQGGAKTSGTEAAHSPVQDLKQAREDAAHASEEFGTALQKEAEASSTFSKELGAAAKEKRDESIQADLLVKSQQGRLRAIQIKDQALQDKIIEAGKRKEQLEKEKAEAKQQRELLRKEKAEAAKGLHKHQQDLEEAARNEVTLLRQLKKQRQRVAHMATDVFEYEEADGGMQP